MTQHPADTVRAVVEALAGRVDDIARWLDLGGDDALVRGCYFDPAAIPAQEQP